jgi:3-phosphoshikimate 1-carboxyvinyltransferase
LLALAAAFAQGTTRIEGVGDLRVKESDRVAAILALLSAIGIAGDCEGSTLRIEGGTPVRPSEIVRTRGDHRIAMAASVLGRAVGPLELDDATCINVSFPAFLPELERLRS